MGAAFSNTIVNLHQGQFYYIGGIREWFNYVIREAGPQLVYDRKGDERW